MSRPLKLAIGISVTFVVILLAALIFLRYLVTKSFPITDGVLAEPGLQAAVQIYRDDFGVPHIAAENEHDMFFAIGYVHAQDRLWQMDLTRRVGQGRLSEIFGETTVEFDKLFRTIGIERIAAEIEPILQPEVRKALEAYSAGINTFVAQNIEKLPVEFDMLNYRPEQWEPRHSIIAARMIAWELNMAWLTDVALGMLAEKVDLQKAVEAFPVWDEGWPTIVAQIEDWKNFLTGITRPNEHSQSPVLMGGEFLAANMNFRRFMGSEALQGGSNAWVIGARRSLSGKPILANDLHLPMPAPSRWYQLHFSSPGWDVAGSSLPGAPFVVVGRNQALAWGFTNLMVDDADFFIERVDSSLTLYSFQNQWLPINSREEKIYIGKTDSVTITVHSTHHGPIIDAVHPALRNGHSSFAHYTLSMRWTGLDVSDESFAFYQMNKAGGTEAFEVGVKHLTVPGQNVIFADTAGNIGYWAAARIPIRGKLNPMMPMPGWTGENDWRGYVPFEKLPKLWNPAEGFIATANNKPIGESFPYYISELWEPPYRITRIRQLLQSVERLGADDFRLFQTDVVSLHGEELLRELLRLFKDWEPDRPDAVLALEYLRNWDLRYNKEDVASTLLNVTFVRLLHNTFKDELGDSLFKHYVTFSAIPHRVLSRLLTSEGSAWFDDVTTPEVETKDEIVRKSLYDALDELQQRFGPDMKTWRWGNIHTVTFEHAFGKRKPLDRVFNIGPFAIGGSASTVNKADFPLANPYAVRVGPSVRHVIDLASNSSFASVITSGQSGQPLHKHYDDQTLLWLNGGYHTIVMEWDEIRAAGWRRLELRPE